MKQLKISVVPPVVDGNVYRHTGTTYIISKNKNFENEENILHKSENNTRNLLDYRVSLDLQDDSPVYVITRFHFTVNGEEKLSGWSRITPVLPNQKGFRVSSDIIKTPTIDVNIKNNILKISTSKFAMYAGIGQHMYSDINITDLNACPVYSRLNDADNLTSIEMVSPLNIGKGYVMSFKHGSDNNCKSLAGRELYLNYTPDTALFDFFAPENFVNNRKFYYQVKIYTTQYKSYDIEIREQVTQRVVKSKYDHKPAVDFFFLDGLELFKIYEIYVRVNLLDGNTTSYKKVYLSSLLRNIINPYLSTIKYLNKLDKGNDLITDGLSTIVTRETFNNYVICSDFVGNSLALYTIAGNALVKIKNLYTFKDCLGVDYINVVQLANHDILVDTLIYNEQRQETTAFIRFEYDPIKQLLKELNRLERPFEKYSTSIANSLIVTNTNKIYYIPSYEHNFKSKKRLDLKMYQLDTENMSIIGTYELPIKYKYNISLAKDHLDNIFVFGGSLYNRYDSKDNNVEYWERDNNTIYKFNPETNEFTSVIDFPEEFPRDIYVLQAFTRLDGKIVIFNGVHSGSSLGNHSFCVFDSVNNTIEYFENKNQLKVPFRSNVIFNNGNILRISSKVLDPQSTYTYISNTKSEELIEGIDTSINEIRDLVVEDGKVINVEDLYKYRSVTIHGSGIVKWYRPQGITELTSKTLVITRNTNLSQTEIANSKYDSILILDGIDVTITNN